MSSANASRRARIARPAPMPPILLRARDVAAVLAISESVVLKYTRAHLLTPVVLPGVRVTRYARTEVEALAERILSGAIVHV